MVGRVDRTSFVVVAGDFEANRLAKDVFEGCDVAVRRPQLELGVARGAQSRQVVVAARIEVDARERLGVAAVEAFGEPNHGRECLDGLAQGTLEIAVAFV